METIGNETMTSHGDFYGRPLVDLPTLQAAIAKAEGLPVRVRLLDARVYPDGLIALRPPGRRSSRAMSLRRWRDKYRRAYPGLDFDVPFHDRMRLGTVRRLART